MVKPGEFYITEQGSMVFIEKMYNCGIKYDPATNYTEYMVLYELNLKNKINYFNISFTPKFIEYIYRSWYVKEYR